MQKNIFLVVQLIMQIKKDWLQFRRFNFERCKRSFNTSSLQTRTRWVTIRGGMSNKYFNKLYKSTKIEGYEILQKTENVPNLDFKQSDGVTPIQGQVNEVILKKL